MKERKRAIRYFDSDKVFLGVTWILLSLFLLLLAYPLLYVIMSSFSGGSQSMTLWLIPRRFSLEGYRAVFLYKYIWIGYLNSIIYMSVGTVIALAVTVCCAYPLSRRDFKGGKYLSALCIFTMYFSGGMIPTYLWIRQMGMMNTIWALVLPGSLSVYNMIVMRTYFNTQIPDELRDAAVIDGCGDFRFLLRIVLPLSRAILAVIGLYYAVSLWNSYFSAMIYLSDRNKYPLTIFLREILIIGTSTQGMEASLNSELESMMSQRAELTKYALIIVSCLPMMTLYPFVQKFFVKGVMIGAVKG